MSQKKLEEILQHGIYGTPELLPEERKLFLSTISERIYLALTNTQVRKRGLYKEAEEIMKKEKNVQLYINGYLNYPSYSNYVQTANKHGVAFTIINDGHDTPIGIVLAANHAIDSDKDFFIKDAEFFTDMPE
ncbi:YueI family protein [Evansella cellulosilytica]|uniref:DUF1694 domain-containing protein n=1 Tax=Evansella cellulosilytica (strain ATCC 21833 / DSM 2522 / FERM P-1141 / JCM 9156 / N-4) TaxID=649639 RepID=E6TWX5_EVAC2|nr:YueI family protein [Evansella cellulosilytica]ADU29925.1 protein of unknown function DUF1694 [Evansella cellulosilytica DSM 2522]